MESRLLVYTDGAARGNPGPAGIGWRIMDSTGKVLEEGAESVGKKTNNEAEYLAVIRALQRAGKYTKGEVVLHSDSELVVRQLRGEYKIKKAHLLELHKKVKKEGSKFKGVTYVPVARENPQVSAVDLLVNRALDQVR